MIKTKSTKMKYLAGILVVLAVLATCLTVFPVGCATVGDPAERQETKDKFVSRVQAGVTGLKWLTVIVDPVFKGLCASGTIDPGACAIYVLAAPLAKSAFEAADQALLKYQQTKQPADLEEAKSKIDEATKLYDGLYKTPVKGSI